MAVGFMLRELMITGLGTKNNWSLYLKYRNGKFLVWHAALVSAGIDIIFFVVAGTGLFFGFSVRIMLTAH